MRLISTLCRWGLLALVGWQTGLTASAQALLPPGLSTNGSVSAWARDGQTLYLAGGFTQIGQYTGNAAMLTPTSALPDRTFPVILGTINAVEPDGTGGWYLGGSNIQIGRNGVGTNLLHMRGDYSVDNAFNANCNGTVNALALNGTSLYVGGDYSAISGQNIRNLTAVDATTGTGTGWVPDPDGGVSTLHLQSGVLYVGGGFVNIAGYKRFRNLAAFSTASGAILTTFPGTNGNVSVILGDSAGGAHVGGGFSRSGWFSGGLERVTTTSDAPTFAFPTLEGTINAMISDGSGGWYIGGNLTSIGGVGVGHLVHLTSTGALDAAWNPNPSSPVSVLARNGTTLYVGGSFTGLGGQTRYNLGAVSTTTGLATTWTADTDGPVNTLALGGTTTLYVGGSFQTIGGEARSNLAALTTATAAVTAWNPNPDGGVGKLLLSGSTLYVGGGFYNIGGQARTNLAAVSTSTGAATAFDPAPDGGVSALALSGTTLYVGGGFGTIGGQSRGHLGAVNASTGVATAWNPTVDNSGLYININTLTADATNLYVGGFFSQMGGVERQNLAQFTLSTGAITTWHPAPDGTVNAVGLNSTAVVFGGAFNYVKSLPRQHLLHVNSSNLVDGFRADGSYSIHTMLRAVGRLYLGGYNVAASGQPVAAVDPVTGALIATFSPQFLNGNYGSQIYTLCRAGGKLFLGGLFETVNQQPRHQAAAVNLLDGAIDGWDPQSNGYYAVGRIKLLGSKILMHGGFTMLQTRYRSGLASIDTRTSTVTGWRQGLGAPGTSGGSINALVVAGSTIYMGGYFGSFDGISRTNVASISKTTGALTTWGPIVDGPVYSMIVNGTNVYVGGNFQNAALAARPNLAAMHYTTGAPVGGFAPAVNGPVSTLLLDGTTLYAGGSFNQIGGLSRPHFGAVSAGTGTGVAGFNATANSTVQTMAVVGSTLYAGGDFTNIGGQPRNYAAALSKTSGLATAWNPAPNGSVATLTADAANVAMSGSFSAMGNQPASTFGVASAITGEPQPFDAQLNSGVSAVLLQQDTLYVSGSFSYVGQQSRYNLARFKLSAAPIGPNITSFAPTSGSVGGVFTITGINFTGATSVLLNGQATTFTVNSPTTITVTVPAGATTGTLTVVTPNGTAYSLGTYTVAPAPTLSGFSPPSGPVGTDVQIYGSNLTGSTVVRFNGTTTGTFAVDSDNQITATVPAGATTGPISVTAPGGTVTTIQSFTVTGTPIITAFSPATGIVGSQVVVTGNYFTGATDVSFNNVNAPTYTVNTVNQITVTVPVGATTGAIRVTTAVGTGVSADNFTVTTVPAPTITAFSPGSGPVGATVTLTGTNLTGASSVTFNNVNAPTYTVNSASTITVTVPTGATSGNIRVQTPGGIATSSSVFLVTVPAPTLTSFTPTSGTEGAVVTLTGTGFGTASQVTFNGVAVGFNATSATSITTSVPVGATTGPITVTNPGGTATSATNFTVTLPPTAPTLTGFTPTFGPVGTTVTVTGSGFSTVTSVAFNGISAASFSIASNTQLTAVVAAGTATGPITITNPGGAITSAAAFTVTGGGTAPTITALSPTSGAVGAAVTITGTNFTGATLVKFNGTNATFTVNSATSIATSVPVGATTGLVTVTTSAGTATAPVTFTVTGGGGTPAPTVTSFTPTSGTVGTAVTITGADFTGASAVSFAGTAATYTVASATSITTSVPAGAISGTISVTTAGGTATSATAFTVTVGGGTAPVIVAVSPARNARAASAGANTVVTFDQAMSPASASALRVFGAQTGKRAGTASGSGSALSFDPTVNFKPGELINATVTTAAQNAGGLALDKGQVYQFSAAAAGGLGTFTGTANPSVGASPRGNALADVDGDGDLDLLTVLAAASGTVSVRLNDGTGTYSGTGTVAVGGGPRGLILGDVDGDGDVDLVTANSGAGSTTASVRLNNGLGTFSGTQNVAVGATPYDVKLADVDADGDLDLLAANYGSASVSIRLNDGAGTFSGTHNVAVGATPFSLAVGDVDNDGDVDVVTASYAASGTLSVRLNDGTGTYSGTGSVAVGSNPTSVALADVDGDGDVDALSANYSSGTVSVRTNNGTGTFSGTQNVAVGATPASVALGDLDADGDLDLVAANYLASGTMAVRLNDGAGTFAGTGSVGAGANPVFVALGDVDNDGDVDAAVANLNSATVSIRLNQNSAAPAAPTITSFTPASGLVGAAVTITGTNFTGASAVSFAGTAATYTVASATSITTSVPAGAISGTISVTTAGGTATSATNFTVGGGPALAVDAVTGALPGAQVLVPVRVTNFTSLIGLQASLSFDPAVLTLVGVEGFGFTDLDAADFGTAQAATGRLTLSWSSTGNATTTLAANAQLVAVRFTVNAAATSGTTAVALNSTPLALLAVYADLTTVVPTTTAGSVTVPAGVALTGALLTGSGAPVAGATVRATGPGAARATAASANGSGAYTLSIVGSGAYSVAPQKANDATLGNGVDVLDVALIQRHILGASLLGNAYKVVAADVDRTNSVNVADVAHIRDLLLGNRTSFPKGRLWTFVRAAQTFANANSPWPVDTAIAYASVAAATGQNFVGCKLGDVNDSWNAAIPRPSTGAAPLALALGNATALPGQLLTVPLSVAAPLSALAALQLTVTWDPAVVRLTSATPGAALPGVVFSTDDAANGHLTLVWTDAAGGSRALLAGDVVLNLEFEALTVGSSMVGVTSDVTPALAFDAALDPLPLTLTDATVSIGPLGIGATVSEPVVKLWPNPAHEMVLLAGPAHAAVTVVDALGRVVRNVRLDETGAATLDVRGLSVGVYGVRVGATTKRLVVE